ncbi:GNAT family N-acetyltransferase [Thalassospiraceae bacterium LMO-JJ14]|nr:GNAT family N-acetyltransferase [Thalassospiraceae bacterium LMO-JJ14]
MSIATCSAAAEDTTEIAARVADVIVREATDDDAEDVIQLIGEVYDEFQGCVLLVDEEEPELKAPQTAFANLGGHFWVAECQDRICGTIALTPTDAPRVARLNKLYVSDAARGRGLGETLCQLVERTAKDEMNADMIMLYTDSRFLDAHRLYERLGYHRQPGLMQRADASNSVEYVYTKKL